MNAAEQLDQHLADSETNAAFSEAVLTLDDGSRLCFCHTVEQRWAKATGPEANETAGGLAAELVEQIRQQGKKTSPSSDSAKRSWWGGKK